MSDLPEIGSVWKKGNDDFLRIERHQLSDKYPLVVKYFGGMDCWNDTEWIDWSRDAVCIWSPSQGQPQPQQPSESAPVTVRVRAAVGFDLNGYWHSEGGCGMSDDVLVQRVARQFGTPIVTAFIEADVPLPIAPTIQGRATTENVKP